MCIAIAAEVDVKTEQVFTRYICICTVPFVLSNLLVHVFSTHFTVIPEHLFIKK